LQISNLDKFMQTQFNSGKHMRIWAKQVHVSKSGSMQGYSGASLGPIKGITDNGVNMGAKQGLIVLSFGDNWKMARGDFWTMGHHNQGTLEPLDFETIIFWDP
jgi:hypothetical protein